MSFNNSYSTTYRDAYITVKRRDSSSKINKLGLLNVAKCNIDTVLRKRIKEDLLGDGSGVIEEMMTVFWNSFYYLLLASKMIINSKYTIDDQECCDYESVLLNDLKNHYLEINESILTTSYFSKYSDEELITFYNDIEFLNLGFYSTKDKNDLIIPGSAEDSLKKMAGLSDIKKLVKKIKIYAKTNKDSSNLNLHMAFYGNPGTGKTEVARLISEILYESGALPTKKIIEVDRSKLVAGYVGWTAIRTREIIESAIGGVLFIDEAYSLASEDSSKSDFGAEAINTLIKGMEDYKGKVCVILAGYKNQLSEMIETNPGFKSRIQFHLDFPNYSRSELKQISQAMLSKKEYEIAPNALEKILDITEILRKNVNFANAREIRNIIDQVILCQNIRVSNSKDKLILINDVNQYISDSKIILPVDTSHGKKILSAEEELDKLIGLSLVKKTIAKIKAYVKKNKGASDFNIHMCFYGNPGTGKTEVARILSRLFYEIGVLNESKIIETDSTGLIAKYVGQTAPKTLNLINDSMDGVLFIDEAYSLCDDGTGNNFGDEAITILLKEMENRRGQFCVILAGYKNEMQKMLSSNPGFESRIQFILNFPDYTRDELKLIAKVFLNKKKYTIADNALERVLDITDYEREKPNYANARNVRNILDQVIMNQNLRTDGDNARLIIIDDVNEYISENDIPLALRDQGKSSYKIDIDDLKERYYDFESEIDLNYIEQTVLSISCDKGQGTGCIISPNGLCITCNHCIVGDGSSQKARIVMTLANGKKIKQYYNMELLKRDSINDIAIFRILDDDMQFDFMPLAMAKYKYVPLTDFILAGYPFGGETYTNISFTEGKIASVNDIGDITTIFADMFGKPGNSGSPVIDKRTKKVIGIFWGAITRPGTNESINCFTPINKVWDLLDK